MLCEHGLVVSVEVVEESIILLSLSAFPKCLPLNFRVYGAVRRNYAGMILQAALEMELGGWLSS